MVTKGMLHELFEYKNGVLYSRINRKQTTIKEGDVIGGINDKGYLRTYVNNKHYKVHRLVFMMFHGYMPNEIDHINGIKTDNRIENLREVTRSQNLCNKTKLKNNTSGVKGVCFNNGKWRVRVAINNKRISVGVFDDLELAELVAIEARIKFHGNYAKH